MTDTFCLETVFERVTVYLFVLDATPLLLAVGIWVTMWPSALLEKIFEKRFSGEGAYSLQKTSS